MKIHPLHNWDLSPADAVALQRELAARIDVRQPLTGCDLVAGADVSHERFSTTLFALVVVLRASDWSVVEVQGAVREMLFPYVPGLLSFREAPVLLEAFARVKSRPDVVMIDGQGIAHPRRMGIAAHVGLWLDVPCMGCAKSRLYGKYKEPGPKPGDLSPLTGAGGDVIGSALRTRKNASPVFVSAGHRIDLPSSLRLVLQSCRGYRLPEPTRQAHRLVNEYRRSGAVPAPEPRP
jgi:deoxyribonuclease V